MATSTISDVALILPEDMEALEELHEVAFRTLTPADGVDQRHTDILGKVLASLRCGDAVRLNPADPERGTS
jgi:hypothetical protein